MKNKIYQAFLLSVICMTGFSNMLSAQSIYKITESKDNDMTLSGTSTLHDWDMSTKDFTGDAQFGFTPENDNQLTSLSSLTFTLVALNLKSGKKGLDKNAYEALKTDQYKNIFYKLVSATVLPEKDSKYLIKTVGKVYQPICLIKRYCIEYGIMCERCN